MNVYHLLVIQSCEGNLYVLVQFCFLQVHSASESRGIQNGERQNREKRLVTCLTFSNQRYSDKRGFSL